jgi:hypothetical protein
MCSEIVPHFFLHPLLGLRFVKRHSSRVFPVTMRARDKGVGILYYVGVRGDYLLLFLVRNNVYF